MNKKSRIFAFTAIFLLSISALINILSITAEAKAGSSAAVYNSVKKAYGNSFPLSSANLISTDLKNIFGQYSTVLGVSAKYFSEYKAAKKSSSKEEYVCFICKARKSSDVKTIKAAMKKFVANETKSNKNYFSSKGMKLLKQAKIGAKDGYVYLFILDTANNKKAVKAFKKALT